MLFNTLHFAVFFVVVYAIVAPLSRRIVARNAVLLVASYYFYGWWDWRFLGLLVISTLGDYAAGLLLNIGEPDPAKPPVRTRRDRVILAVNIALNLGMLGFFKYYGFFVQSATAALQSLGFHTHLWSLKIILPVGISFYTFQSISYVIDVYRGHVAAERSLLNYATYIAFFPQLVAGPIERGAHLIPQFRRPTVITWEGIYQGTFLIGVGLFKKVVLADNAAHIVDAVFAGAHPGAIQTMAGVYAFWIQVYCDFSGYSDIARGTAQTMGFSLMENFNCPWLATNPADFWQRWHISLGTWLRDYLYFPMGGNRKGSFRTYFNLMTTMVLGGLWHGAAWTYVIWGTYHGVILCLHRAVKPWMQRFINPTGLWTSRLWLATRIVVFFHMSCFALLLFRSQSVHHALSLIGGLARFAAAGVVLVPPKMFLILASCGLVLFLAELAQYFSKDRHAIFRLPVPVRAVVYATGILGFVFFGEYGGQSFIYFQF